MIQNRQEVLRCQMTDVVQLGRLVTLFFGYERREIREFRKAVAQFRADLPAVLEALRGKIDAAYSGNAAFLAAASSFLEQAKQTINPVVCEADVREMLIQHILTEEIFANVFNESDFHRENNIAKALYGLEAQFFTGGVKKDTLKALEPYYAAIRMNAAQITSHAQKQTFLKVIYENFYKVYNPKAADRLGVVYTPNEIVRFMIEGADWLCQTHFGRTLIDRDVEILDPATGTGTFICELLEHFRGQPQKLSHKYKEELHANEIAILPYYVANLNIEATYAAITGQFAEFPNLCFVDTLDNVAGLGIRSGHQHELFGAMSEENVERIKRQNRRKISVVLGNPPYNAWQENFNNRNPNRAYRRVDERIRSTYAAKGSAQNLISVYDMYTRFFRWASDRLHDDGVLAFVSNRNFIEKAAFDGFRKDVAAEFAEIYLMDLGGDVRANPKLSGTKHNVFGIQTGVTISLMVKRRGQPGGRIFYARRPEYDTGEEKLAFLGLQAAQGLNWQRIEPDRKGNWLNQSDNDWDQLIAVCSKDEMKGKRGRNRAIFSLMSNGVKTQRDEWVYDRDKGRLEAKVRFLIGAYESTKSDRQNVQRDTIKWDADLERHARNGIVKIFDPTKIVKAAYRPFTEAWLYFDRHLNGRTYQLPSMFRLGSTNSAICFLGIASSHDFAALAVTDLPDLCLLKQGNGGTLCVSRYRYTPTGERLDNITDWALKQFQKAYGSGGRSRPSFMHPSQPSAWPQDRDGWQDRASQDHPAQDSSAQELAARNAETAAETGSGAERRILTKDDIFHYVYGVLHDPVYRDTYAQNLKRELPRLPLYPDFWRWAGWGARLMALHAGYDTVEPWPFLRRDQADDKARAAGSGPGRS